MEHFLNSSVLKTKKPQINLRLLYSGRDLNPYNHYWSQDFKSCVSTNSTTRVLRKKKYDSVVLFHLSRRRDSNPRPRPWQGRALPTELLLHECSLERIAKIQPNFKFPILSAENFKKNLSMLVEIPK